MNPETILFVVMGASILLIGALLLHDCLPKTEARENTDPDQGDP
jgi:hypothetical protein